MASFDQAVKLYFKNYANFSGRASRSMYWWVYLFNTIWQVIAYIILILLTTSDSIIDNFPMAITIFSALIGLFGLALLIPSISLAVRRLHDVGKGGGWLFIAFIPLVGTIWLLVLFLTPGDYDDNRFGPNPEYTDYTPY